MYTWSAAGFVHGLFFGDICMFPKNYCENFLPSRKLHCFNRGKFWFSSPLPFRCLIMYNFLKHNFKEHIIETWMTLTAPYLTNFSLWVKLESNQRAIQAMTSLADRNNSYAWLYFWLQLNIVFFFNKTASTFPILNLQNIWLQYLSK